MPIFKIEARKAKQLRVKAFGSEKGLQQFFEANLEELLGVKFLASEYPATDGYIDTLGIDESGSPVIIEYKYKEKDDVLSQGLFYYNWLVQNKPHFNLLVSNKFGDKVKVNWEHPRVILVAQSFNRYTQSAVQQMVNIELKKYMVYENGLFYLESIYTPARVKTKRASREEKKAYGIDYHLQKTSANIRDIFLDLQEKILSLGEVEEKADQKVGVTYRTTKSFVRFEFGKSYVNVLLREEAAQADPRGLAKDISNYQWGYPRLAKIKSQDDADYIFSLIRKSYESTL
jgi:predicted transport protein